jgi:hypothetical protein
VAHRLLALAILSSLADADIVVSTLKGPPVRGAHASREGDRLRIEPLGTPPGPVEPVALDSVIEIASEPAPRPPGAPLFPFEVELTDGSTLRGSILGDESGSLVVTSPSVERTTGLLSLPVEQVRAVRRLRDAEGARGSKLAPIAERDVAYRETGARVEGVVARFTATGVEIDRPGEGLVEVGFDQLAALFVDNPAVADPEGLLVVVRTAEGGAVKLGRDFRYEAGRVEGTTPAGFGPLAFAPDKVSQIGFRGGGFADLSDLPPSKVEREPFFPLPEGAGPEMLAFLCPVRRDLSPDGRPISLDGRRYSRGFGVRPRTVVHFDLPAGFREFRALCGIDDEIFLPGYGTGGGAGSVIFSLLVDGRAVFESEPVTGGRPPVEVAVPIAGAKSLALAVSLVPKEKNGGKPDTPELDNAVWARPILVR